MKNKFSKYFLGANSAEGFISHFGDNFDCFNGWRAIIIKGGPGTGKSSFMKYITAHAVDAVYKSKKSRAVWRQNGKSINTKEQKICTKRMGAFHRWRNA